MVLADYLERNAVSYANDVALVELNPEAPDKKKSTWKEYALVEENRVRHFRRELTWKEFNDMANKVADVLFLRGIKKGDKVGILLMNCLEWLPIYFGILKTGALAVPLNFRYAAEEIAYCVDLAEVNLLVFGPEFIGRVEKIVDKLEKTTQLFYVGDSFCPTFAENFVEYLDGRSEENPDVPLTQEDDAAIYFSSGTTGFPKAILHSHRALMHAAVVEQKHHGQTRDDVFLCIPPLYHTGAKMHWMGSLVSASKAVLLRGTTPETIMEAISNERCTIVWLLVPWAQDILEKLDNGTIKLSDYHVKQFRLMHIGAQPVPQSLIKHWQDYFPGQLYDTNYGLSESIGPGAVHLGVENIKKVGAIGVPGYGWQAKIVTEDGVTEVKRGEVGELALKGPGVMRCYYRNEKATREVMRGDWLLTGDMAKQDEDGFYYLVDRKKDVIVCGGENLYPVEIENFLHKYEKIKDVAVIGLPDKRLGEIPAAIIETFSDDCTQEEVEDFCLNLPRYKRPRKIIFAKVPRNATGKIEKPLLRKIYNADNIVDEQNKS
ncbi:MAG: acyl--CoA ligase [Clostridia bacterium]|nr:acyl--CoA ligase [Clostridia bacterium]